MCGKEAAAHFRSVLKFIPAALRMAFILSPRVAFSLLRSIRCSRFRYPIPGSTAALHFNVSMVSLASRSTYPQRRVLDVEQFTRRAVMHPFACVHHRGCRGSPVHQQTIRCDWSPPKHYFSKTIDLERTHFIRECLEIIMLWGFYRILIKCLNHLLLKITLRGKGFCSMKEERSTEICAFIRCAFHFLRVFY